MRHTRCAGAAARRRRQVGAGDACAPAPRTSRSACTAEDGEAVEANSCCEEEGLRAGGSEGAKGGRHVKFVLFDLVLLGLRIFAGAERGSRVSQGRLDPRCVRVHAAEHASRGPF